MSTEVSKVARSYLRGRHRDTVERTVTFSIRLTEGQHAKLRFLASKFETPKSPFAQALLNAAMDECLSVAASEKIPDEIYADAEFANSHGSPDAYTEVDRLKNKKLDEYHEQIRRLLDEEE